MVAQSMAVQSATTIVLIVLDDLGRSDIGYTGSGIATPTLDHLAAGGTQLSAYYVQRACSPSRAALLTGRYPTRYGFQSGVLEPRKPYGLSLSETLLPQRLGALGYATHAVGKWHLGFYSWEHTPTFRGFESFLGYYTGYEDYYQHQQGGAIDLRHDEGPRCGANCSQVLWEARGEYSTHIFTRRATDVIRSTPAATPLFLYLAYQAVHCPAQAPESYIRKYNFSNHERNVFAGMLSAADEGIANVTKALRAARDFERTLIIVTTDNGAPTTGCGGAQGGQNWPWRGGKCSAWDGGLLGIAFVYGPGVGVRKNATLGHLAHLVDMYPTILDFAISRPTSAPLPLDGISMLPALRSGAAPAARGEVLLEADPYAFPLSGRTWGGDEHATPYYAIRRGRYKLIIGDPGIPGILDAYYCTGPPCPASHDNARNASAYPRLASTSVQLFDVGGDDPYEAHDLAPKSPDLVRELTRRLVALNASAVSSAGQGLPDDPAADPAKHNGTISPWVVQASKEESYLSST